MGDIEAAGGQALPVFLVPLFYVAAGVEVEASTLEQMSIGAPVGSLAGIDVVLVEGHGGGRGREQGLVVG